MIRYLYKLMAYKNEYEVARLYLKEPWHQWMQGLFAEPERVVYNLHPPPLLRALELRRKVALGPWFRHVFLLLKGMRWLRGTRFDPFGYHPVRREERQLIAWYRGCVEEALRLLQPETYELAVAIAKAPDAVRGYEGIKMASVRQVKARVEGFLGRLRDQTPVRLA